MLWNNTIQTQNMHKTFVQSWSKILRQIIICLTILANGHPPPPTLNVVKSKNAKACTKVNSQHWEQGRGGFTFISTFKVSKYFDHDCSSLGQMKHISNWYNVRWKAQLLLAVAVVKIVYIYILEKKTFAKSWAQINCDVNLCRSYYYFINYARFVWANQIA